MLNYLSNNDGTFGYCTKKEYIPCGDDIRVIDVRNDIESNTCYFDVEFPLAQYNKVATITFETLKNELNRIGYSISNANESHVRAYLHQQINEMKSAQVYCNLGWCRLENQVLFKGHELKYLDKEQAHYNGNYDIQPRGKLDDFQKCLKKLIIGNTPLEVAVTLGLSACVVGYIRLHTSVSNLICSIHGRTTTGKTTAAKLAISMGGNPYCGDDKISLAGTCSTTANAMYGQLRGNHGYPMLFDELGSISKSTDIEQLLYCIAEGEDKKRMTKSGDIRLLEKWSTTIIFTSEHPILNSNVQTGLNVRVINLADVEWTKSAEQARKIESFSRVFAGLGIDMLADYIVNNASGIYQSYESYVSEISNNLKVDSSLKVRTSKPIATLKLTVELASKAFGVQFNVDEIVQFIVNAVEKEKPIPSWKKMYDEVLQHIEKEKNIFLKGSPLSKKVNQSTPDEFGSCCGYIEYRNEQNTLIPQYCIVTEVILKKWCIKYEDFQSNLKEWFEKGLLEKQKHDRYIRDEYISLSSAKVKCYKILYNDNYSVGFREKSSIKGKAKTSLKYLKYIRDQLILKNANQNDYAEIDNAISNLDQLITNCNEYSSSGSLIVTDISDMLDDEDE